MNIVLLSKLLIVLFVGSVTLWYCITPYIINPHPGIVQDVLQRTKLSDQAVRVEGQGGQPLVLVENWTKWRLYVNNSQEEAHSRVIYGNSKAKVPLKKSAVMRMEWREEYEIHVSRQDSSSSLSVERRAPPAGRFGIYDHFLAEDGEDSAATGTGTETGTAKKEEVVRVVPRFLFGLPFATIGEMYGDDIANFPVVGVFSESPRFDRIIIQAYMNMVTLSVIFLLYANNPPDSVVSSKKKA